MNMKKLLSFLSGISLIATPITSVMACHKEPVDNIIRLNTLTAGLNDEIVTMVNPTKATKEAAEHELLDNLYDQIITKIQESYGQNISSDHFLITTDINDGNDFTTSKIVKIIAQAVLGDEIVAGSFSSSVMVTGITGNYEISDLNFMVNQEQSITLLDPTKATVGDINGPLVNVISQAVNKTIKAKLDLSVELDKDYTITTSAIDGNYLESQAVTITINGNNGLLQGTQILQLTVQGVYDLKKVSEETAIWSINFSLENPKASSLDQINAGLQSPVSNAFRDIMTATLSISPILGQDYTFSTDAKVSQDFSNEQLLNIIVTAAPDSYLIGGSYAFKIKAKAINDEGLKVVNDIVSTTSYKTTVGHGANAQSLRTEFDNLFIGAELSKADKNFLKTNAFTIKSIKVQVTNTFLKDADLNVYTVLKLEVNFNLGGNDTLVGTVLIQVTVLDDHFYKAVAQDFSGTQLMDSVAYGKYYNGEMFMQMTLKFIPGIAKLKSNNGNRYDLLVDHINKNIAFNSIWSVSGKTTKKLDSSASFFIKRNSNQKYEIIYNINENNFSLITNVFGN